MPLPILNTRVTPELRARVEKAREVLQLRNGVSVVTTSDTVREAMRRGLAQIEAEGPPEQPAA